jgi:WD40 repeat protein
MTMCRRALLIVAVFSLVASARADDPLERQFAMLDAGGHTAVIKGVFFTPDGRKLITVSNDKTIRVWEVASGRCEQVLRGHDKEVYGVAFSPDGLQLGTAALDTSARLWNVADGRELAVLCGHERDVNCVAWSPDGKTIATGSDDRSIRLWDPDSTLRRCSTA